MADKNSFAFLSRSAPLLEAFGINAYCSPIVLRLASINAKNIMGTQVHIRLCLFSSLKCGIKIFDNQCPELLELEKAYFPS